MSLRIRDHNKCPPGNYYIRVLLREGVESIYFGPCKGTPGCFQAGPSPIIGDVAKKLSAFRAANNIPRSEYPSALEDVDAYTCQRIGGMKEWCYDTDQPYALSNPAAVRPATPCATCGHQLQ